MPKALEKIPHQIPPFQNNTALSMDTNRPQSQPSSASDDIDHPGYQDYTHSRAEHPSDYRPQLEDIPELETDEKTGRKANLMMQISLIITTPLRKVTEYITSTHFKKVTEQEYSSYHGTTSEFEYQILEPEYYNSDTRPKQHQRYQNPNIYLPPQQSTEDQHT